MDRVQAMQKIADVAVGSAFENLKFKLRAIFGAGNVVMTNSPFPQYCITRPGDEDDIVVAHAKNLPDAEHRVGDVGIC